MKDEKILPYIKFCFSILNPTLEDCWAYGYNAAKNEISSKNPFEHNSPNYHHWEDGWWKGFYAHTSHNDQIYDLDQAQETSDKIKENISSLNKKTINHSNLLYKKKMSIKM